MQPGLFLVVTGLGTHFECPAPCSGVLFLRIISLHPVHYIISRRPCINRTVHSLCPGLQDKQLSLTQITFFNVLWNIGIKGWCALYWFCVQRLRTCSMLSVGRLNFSHVNTVECMYLVLPRLICTFYQCTVIMGGQILQCQCCTIYPTSAGSPIVRYFFSGCCP